MKSVPVYLIPTTLLAACGSGGGVNSTPTPLPPPPPTVTYDSFNALPTQTFQASGVDLTVQETRQGNQAPVGSTPTVRQQPYGGNLSISYNAANGSYTVFDPTINSTFAAGDLITNFVDPSVKGYEKRTGSINANSTQEFLVVYRSGESTPPLPLSYASYFTYQRTNNVVTGDNNPLTNSERLTMYGVFGFETLTSDMPRTGNATIYRTYGIGELQLPPGVDGASAAGSRNVLSGFQASFDVNFLSGAINTNMTFQNWNIGNVSQQVQFFGSGAITSSSNRFTGIFAPNSTGYSGTFDGAFFGPQAAEMGYRFFLSNPNGGKAIGAVLGKKF